MNYIGRVWQDSFYRCDVKHIIILYLIISITIFCLLQYYINDGNVSVTFFLECHCLAIIIAVVLERLIAMPEFPKFIVVNQIHHWEVVV